MLRRFDIVAFVLRRGEKGKGPDSDSSTTGPRTASTFAYQPCQIGLSARQQYVKYQMTQEARQRKKNLKNEAIEVSYIAGVL